jgi:hypothetical protein
MTEAVHEFAELVQAARAGDHNRLRVLAERSSDPQRTLMCSALLMTNVLALIDEGPDAVIAKWFEEAEIMERTVTPPKYNRRMAQVWLKAQLLNAKGRTSNVKALRERASRQGINLDALKDASKDLGVISKPPTGGNVPHRTWTLPKSETFGAKK